MGAFRDFIPEGDDTGALGSGFKDFVPPKKETPPEDKPEEKAEGPKPAPKPNPFKGK
jgi:hypothetical protein